MSKNTADVPERTRERGFDEGVKAERLRCVKLITRIADEMRADAARAQEEGKQLSCETYEHAARVIDIVAKAVEKDR